MDGSRSSFTSPVHTPQPFRMHTDSRNMLVTVATPKLVEIKSQQTGARVRITKKAHPHLRWRVETLLAWPKLGGSRSYRFFTDAELMAAFRLEGPSNRDTWSMASSAGKFVRYEDCLRIPGDTPRFLPDGTSDGSSNADIIVIASIVSAVADLMAAHSKTTI